MNSYVKKILVIVLQTPAIIITFSYLYFIFLPIRYVTIFLGGKYGVSEEFAWWLHIIIVFLLTMSGLIHSYRWFLRDYTIEIKCHNCGKDTIVTHQINLPPIGVEIDPFWDWHMIQSIYQKQMYRPRLHYTCSECGHDEYICPYCHKPIGKDDKRCPHCHKRVYMVKGGYKLI